MLDDTELWEVFAVDDEVEEPEPEYGDFWEGEEEEEP